MGNDKCGYRVFRPTYTDKQSGQPRQSPTFNVAFRDHLNRRQTIAGHTNEKRAEKIAERVLELVQCCRDGTAPDAKLLRWLDALPDRTRQRLVSMDLIDPQASCADVPLLAYLEGRKDDGGAVVEPGYLQAMKARGGTGQHVTQTVTRIKRVLEECGFVF
jgi:hypothetical protein